MKFNAASLLSAAFAVVALAGVARGGVVQANLSALTRSGTALVGIESTSGDIQRSTDGGASGTTVRAATATPLRNLNASGNTVIAVGDGGAISRSTDAGATWTDLSTTAAPAVGPLKDVASSNGTFWVAVGQSTGGKLAAEWSNDGGATWVAATSLPNLSGKLNGVVYDGQFGRWCAVGTDGVEINAVILTSADGKTWTTVTAPLGSAALKDVATDGAGNLLAVGATGTLATSSDGGATFDSEANSGAVSEDLLAVVYSATSGFYVGGQNLVQMAYTVAGGTVVVQNPVPDGGDVNALAVDDSGVVLISGNGFSHVATVTLGNLSATYDGTAKSATATTDPAGLTVNFTYDGSSVAPTNAGNYSVVGTVADTTYNGAASGTLVIAKANQTITFGVLSDTTLAASPLTLSASSTSGLPVTFVVVSGPANVSGNTLNLTGSGTVTVEARQIGNGNYNAAMPVQRSFDINSTVATVVLSDTSATYDGTPKSVTATTNPVGLNVNVTYDGSATAPTDAGSYAVVATISDANYSGSVTGTLTIAKADQTIEFTGPADTAFTTTPITLTANATSGLTVTFTPVSGPATLSGNTVTLLGAGTVVLQAVQTGNANYNAAQPVTRSFTVGGSFETWQLDNFTSSELLDANISGPNAVYGADALTNLMRYALGLPAKTAITAGLPEIARGETDWTFTYTRPSAITDVRYEVEMSTDLVSWSTVTTLEKLTTQGGTDTWRASVSGGTSSPVFFRLKVMRGAHDL